MCAVKDDQSVVIDREPDQDTSHEPSGPRIRCPLCGWSPRKEDKWFCTCGNEWNPFDTGGVCPVCLLFLPWCVGGWDERRGVSEVDIRSPWLEV
jgi:hypothetical protein